MEGYFAANSSASLPVPSVNCRPLPANPPVRAAQEAVARAGGGFPARCRLAQRRGSSSFNRSPGISKRPRGLRQAGFRGLNKGRGQGLRDERILSTHSPRCRCRWSSCVHPGRTSARVRPIFVEKIPPDGYAPVAPMVRVANGPGDGSSRIGPGKAGKCAHGLYLVNHDRRLAIRPAQLLPV